MSQSPDNAQDGPHPTDRYKAQDPKFPPPLRSKTMRDMIRKFSTLTEDHFKEHHPYPFLMQRSFEQNGKNIAVYSTAQESTGSAYEEFGLVECPVFDVRSRRGFGPGSWITIGRADNNDIVLESNWVSKFHAYLKLDGDQWFLCDYGSTNGTFLEGQRLAPKEPVPIELKNKLSFSESIKFSFLSAGQMFNYIRVFEQFA